MKLTKRENTKLTGHETVRNVSALKCSVRSSRTTDAVSSYLPQSIVQSSQAGQPNLFIRNNLNYFKIILLLHMNSTLA